MEIGGGNGILNAEYSRLYPKREWLIVEPSKADLVDEVNARYLRKMWDASFDVSCIPDKYSIIVHTHVMEHLLDVNSFLKKIWERMKFGAKMIFSVPNLKETLKRCYTNALNFEHTYLITEEYIDALMEKYGFTILEKKYFREEHSIFYAVEKRREIKDVFCLDFDALYRENIEMMKRFVDYHKRFVDMVNQKMNTFTHKVYLFGAHIFSQYLIVFGLDTSRVCGILDNDVSKQGKRLYGTNLMVYSPKVLADEDTPAVILKVASYAEEIKGDIVNHINKRTLFLE